MAASVYVIDASLKRTQVRVTPSKYLSEVRDEACGSRKWRADEYVLKAQNGRVLDLSQPWRLAGLSAGAKLQLTRASRSPGVVTVALQLPDGEGEEEGVRLQDKFPSTTSLWLLLRKFEDAVAGGTQKRKLNLTQRGAPSSSSGAGRLLYEQPCVHVMGRNFDTFPELQKTLAHLGLNGGSVAIRLTFKSSGQPLEEAMQDISTYFGAPDAPTEDATAESMPNAVSEKAAEEPIQERDDTPLACDPPEPAVSSDTLPSPPIPSADVLPITSAPLSTTSLPTLTVYAPPTSSTPAAALHPHDPALYEPSLDHAAAHQAALQRASQNKRLPSDRELAERESAKQQQLAGVQSVTVRVRYPDQSLVEFCLPANETAVQLYTRVRDTLAVFAEKPQLDGEAGTDGSFELRFLNAKGVLESLPPGSERRLVRDLGWNGRVLVTLVWGAEASAEARAGPSLREEVRAGARELKVELAGPVKDEEGEKGRTGGAQSGDVGKSKASTAGKGDVEARMKKFLGFGRK